MESQQSLFVEADIEHHDLLKYHLAVTSRVDAAETEKAARLKLIDLQQPPVFQPHIQAPTFHKEQQHPVNENNLRVAERMKNDFKAIEIDDALGLKEKEAAEQRLAEAMKSQLTNAVTRTGEAPADSGIPSDLPPELHLNDPAGSKPTEASTAAPAAIKPPWESQ